jgi:hypothetical protein
MRSLARFRPQLVLVALSLVLGCSDAGTPMSPKPAPTPDPSLIGVVQGLLGVTKIVTNLVDNLLVCTLQLPQQNSATIGPNGGKLSFGPHSLVIPKGALHAKTRITAQAIRGYHARVEFQPTGLQFDVPATVTLSYAQCAVPKGAVQVVYMQSDTTVTEREPSHDYRDQRWVSASIKHFSSYAVAY